MPVDMGGDEDSLVERGRGLGRFYGGWLGPCVGVVVGNG